MPGSSGWEEAAAITSDLEGICLMKEGGFSSRNMSRLCNTYKEEQREHILGPHSLLSVILDKLKRKLEYLGLHCS